MATTTNSDCFTGHCGSDDTLGGGGGGGVLVPSEQYLVVVVTAVSGHILLQVEGTQTCKDGSIVHLRGD